ncbi:MAG: NEW3 domain-containing protein [Pirellulales bacterium]
MPIAPPNDDAAAESRPPGCALRIQLDGGAALVRSPEIPVNPLFTYLVEAQVRVDRLEHDRAFVALTFFDAKRRPIETIISPKIQRTNGWETIRIGPLLPPKNNVTHVELALRLEPLEKDADLRGWAEFADVRIGRLPRITLSSNRVDRIYQEPERPEITCQASGFYDPDARVEFELLDLRGKVLSTHKSTLRRSEEPEPTRNPLRRPTAEKPAVKKPEEPGPKTEPTSPASKPEALAEAGGANGTPMEVEAPPAHAIPPAPTAHVYFGEVQWRPQIKEPGFYRVRVTMPGELGVINRRELALVVVKQLPALAGGEFGWTLPEGEAPLTVGELADLAGQSGISWVKLPVWSASGVKQREDELLWLIERLGMKRIELVGMLCDPPEKVRAAVSGADIDLAAGIFSAPEQVWYPTLEPLISRLAFRVRHWQLGGDRDRSFAGYAEGNARIQLVRKLFARFGQQQRFVVGWDWLRELPPSNPAWDTAVLGAEPGLTADELRTYLADEQLRATKRWVLIEPLPVESYAQDVRTADLLQRMITAKAGKADGIFLPRLCDDSTGIMQSDGSVGPLYLPWRTTAHRLAGTEYAGELPLGPEVTNHVFQRRNECTLAIWSEQPREMRLQLGADAVLLTPWGQEIEPHRVGGETILDVGPTPLLVAGVHPGLLRFQMHVGFVKTQWAAVLGRPQTNAIRLQNSFTQAISGKVRMTLPDGWKASAREIPFEIAPRDRIELPFEVTLPVNAGTGKQSIRMEFEIDAERPFVFETTREVEIGFGDLFAEFSTRITPKNELEIEQRLTNRTDAALSFKCYLYAPGRKRTSLNIRDHGQGMDIKTFYLDDAESLLNQDVKVQIVELDGARTLNYVIKVKP